MDVPGFAHGKRCDVLLSPKLPLTYPTSTVTQPSTILPPCAVVSNMRACGIFIVSTVKDPSAITSGGPTHPPMPVPRPAGNWPINPGGPPGPTIGPPPCGTSTVPIGQ